MIKLKQDDAATSQVSENIKERVTRVWEALRDNLNDTSFIEGLTIVSTINSRYLMYTWNEIFDNKHKIIGEQLMRDIYKQVLDSAFKMEKT